MSKTTQDLILIAEEFTSIAQNVNKKSVVRKKYATSSVELVNKAYITATRLHDEIKQISAANLAWRDKDSTIFSTCRMLHSNLEKMREYMASIKDDELLSSDDLSSVERLVSSFFEILVKAEETLQDVIYHENDILLLDRLLEAKKKYQLESLKTLQKLSQSILADAETAEQGSDENHSRGLKLLKDTRELNDSLEAQEFKAVEELIVDVTNGKERAEVVNKNSHSQTEFYEQVGQFVDQFYSDSLSIQELVKVKHDLFEANLQRITVLTVMISFEFKKFLEMEKVANSVIPSSPSNDVFHNFLLLAEIAIADVKFLTELNLDMTEISHITNESETKTVEITEEEITYYKEIKDKVSLMTEVTEFPIQGSMRNIKNAEKMIELLQQIINENNINVEKGEEVMADSAGSAKKIMVIDDGAAIRQVVSHVLKSEGYDVVEAVDGQDALNKLGSEKIDLFICDVNMPNMNGIEFLEKIKTDEAYRSFKFSPIIMLTTEAAESMKEKGKQLGAHAWMVKPFQPDQLIAKIKPILG